MNTVTFGNDGVIDPRVWSTFGVTVKEQDNPIGQFGTGLKYAIAVCLREGRSIWIKTQDETYRFAVEDTEIRGGTFPVVTCNGRPMPFTTHLGYKWELWQAYRELYSNCVDEGGNIGYDGETRVIAELGDIAHTDVFLDRSQRRLIASTPWADIYAGESSVIYLKGIKAEEIKGRRMRWTYDLKKADLTEDRNIKYNFEIHEGIASSIWASGNDRLIQEFLLRTKDYYEELVDFDWARCSPPDSAIELVNAHRKSDFYIQQSAGQKCIDQLGPAEYEPEEISEHEQRIIEKAEKFCASIGKPVEYPVVKADIGAGKLGLANTATKTIYLSDRVLNQGVKQVASTLLEENLHIKEGLQDCTYDMQSYLFDQIVSMGERLTGEVL